MKLIQNRDRHEFLKSMLENAKGFDQSQNSFIHQSLACAALELEQANREIAMVSEKFDFTNLFGSELDEGIFQRTGLERLDPEYSKGEILISGKNGTVIKLGTVVKSDDLNFKTTEEGIIQSGQALIPIIAEETGYDYNVPVGAINELQNNNSNVTDITNPKATYGGKDSESDDDFKKRAIKQMREPAKAGNLYHFEQWVNDCKRVYDCKAFRRWKGQQTVRVVVAMDEGIQATEEDIQGIYEELDEKQVIPFGADLLLESVTVMDLPINCNLKLKDNFEIDDVIKSIEENINRNLVNKPFTVDFTKESKDYYWVFYGEIATIIQTTEGVDYFDALYLDSKNSNFACISENLCTCTVAADEIIE